MRSKKKTYYIFAALLGLLIFAVYFNILDNEPTNWDDPALFSRETIHEISIANLSKVLAFHGGATYQPIRDLTYMIDFAIWGKEGNVVFGMHLQSIILYFLMSLVCWLFLLELFKVFVDDPSVSFTWASISTVLFVVHPVHVESIAWLYARKEPLLGIFTFLSLWAFVKGRTGRWKFYGISAAALVLAILSKPTALMLPGVMIVLDFVFQAQMKQPSFWRRRLLLYIPVLIFVVFMAARLLSVMFSVGGVKLYHGGTFWTNLLAVSQILISYISLIGFTINYSADYPIKLYADPHAWQAWVFVALNCILLSSACMAYVKKRYLYAIFVLWYYIFLLPVSHIFPIAQVMADRYAFLPSLSWCVFLGFLLTRLWYLRLSSTHFSPEFPKLIAIALLGVALLSYSFMTVRQNNIWQNAQILWEDTLAKYPNSSSANVNLAAIYLEQRRYQDAQDLCLNAIKAKPWDYLAISNLALAQMMMKQYDHAIHNYTQALKLKPDLPKAEMGLANAYWKIRDYENTHRLYSKLFRQGNAGLPHQMAQNYYRLGYVSWKLDRKEEAYEYFGRAQKMSREKPMLLKDLGIVYTSMGDYTKAEQAYKQLLPLLKDEKLHKQLMEILKILERYQTSGQS